MSACGEDDPSLDGARLAGSLEQSILPGEQVLVPG